MWFDIACGYSAIAATVVALVVAERRWPGAWPLLAAGGALLLGYAIAYVQLFFHEAAHHLIAPGRRLNDALANAVIGWMVGQDIKAYRLFHFEHHRHLGTPQDTERSYFDAIDARFLLEAFTGIKLLRMLRARALHVRALDGPRADAVRASRLARVAMLAVGIAANLAILALAAWQGVWSLFWGWGIGMLAVHPAINTIRQALEHRHFDADPSVDYAQAEHGVHTRTFGRGPLASTLGGAGFNRHLMHHWEPQVSYTRFDDLERFLLDTDARGAVEGVRATYAGAFARLARRR